MSGDPEKAVAPSGAASTRDESIKSAAGRHSTASEAITKVETNRSQKAAATRIPSALPAEDENIEYPGPFKLFLIMLAIMLAIFLVALDQTIIATAIPRITDQFHSIDDIGW
jgi:hypothetical protein